MHVPSGVPQGSILGPLFLNLFINDIPDVVNNSHCLMYADDLKLYRVVSTEEDARCLQEDLDAIILWSRRWGMSLNVAKCKFMSISLKNKPIHFDYKIVDILLEKVLFHRDLGVFIDRKLTFCKHVNHIICKANRMLGFIWRNCRNIKSPKAIITLYRTLVTSHLEYCCVIFSSASNSQLNRIDKIHFKFNRFFVNCFGYPCGLLAPTDRFFMYDMLFLYRCINSLYSSNFVHLFGLHVNCRRLRSSHVFDVPFGRVSVYKRSFISRLPSSYNLLVSKNCNIDIFFNSFKRFRSLILNSI